MSFVRAPNPIWYLPDLIGQPLNDQYYAFFLTNTFPYLPQDVYRDPQGQTVWAGDVVQFFPNGTLPDNLYFDPTKTYRIEIRQGQFQSDPLIYEINNFIPGNGVSSISNLSILTAENLATNGNFSQVFFSPTAASFPQPTMTITAAGTYLVAPGWFLDLVGNGVTVLTQFIFSGSSSNTSPNAINYALRVNNQGWTSAILRQRFNNNGAIFTGGAISMMVTARAQSVNKNISLIYQPSDSGVPATIVPNAIETGLLTTGDFRVVQGTISAGAFLDRQDFPVSVNLDLSTIAYVDMEIILPPIGIVDLTDFQVVGQSNPLPVATDPLTIQPAYQQQSQERIIDNTFHIYRDSLLRQSKDNLLTGWTFAQNPWQFVNPAPTTPVTNQCQYIADQTILYQETAGAYLSGRGNGGINFGLQLISVNGVNANRFALIQYIDSSTTLPYWGQILSSLVRSGIFISPPSNTKTTMKARLIYRTAGDAIPIIPTTLTSLEPIIGWDANGDLLFSAGWTAIKPLNDEGYLLQQFPQQTSPSIVQNNLPAMAFEKFQLPSSPSATPYMGLVIYITAPLTGNTVLNPDVIAFDRISLVPNDFAIDANPKTFDKTLRECQFYYEKSYQLSDQPGAVDSTGLQSFMAVVERAGIPTGSTVYENTFYLPYKQTKRVNPDVHFYSLEAIPTNFNRIQMQCYVGTTSLAGSPTNLNSSQWFAPVKTVDGLLMQPINGLSPVFSSAGSLPGYEAVMNFHYTADARLGI